ncbi:MAG: Gfo/Idh/MocA family oxidoreductase [Reyranellaceae bacterium]
MVRRVLLCGAGYGEAYRRVFKAIGAQLIGVVGRGGRRSRSLASAMQVPWSRDLSQFLPQADLVIVAIGGVDGDRLAMESLHHAVPVLREHPVSSKFVARAARVAALSRVPWLVNPHFAYLRAPTALISRCHFLARTGPPRSVSVLTNARMAFSAIDLLLRVSDVCGIAPGRATITRTDKSVRSTWRHAVGVMTLEIGMNFSADDNERDVMTGHRFGVDFGGTQLRLRSAAGPLVELAGAPGARRSETVPCQSRKDFLQDRELANLKVVQAMLVDPPAQADRLREHERIARTARIWESMLRPRW